MQPAEIIRYVQAGDGGVGAVIFVIFVIGSIISSAVKASKEKKQREERMRSMGQSPSQPKRSTAYNTPKAATSIDDFLRELAGETKPRPAAPAPQPQPQPQPQVWRAPQEEIDDFMKAQQAEETRELKQKQDVKQRRLNAERRQAQVDEQERKAHAVRQKREKSSIDDGGVWATQISNADAYKERTVVKSVLQVSLGTVNRDDLRKAIAMKEILGKPLALREQNAGSYEAY